MSEKNINTLNTVKKYLFEKKATCVIALKDNYEVLYERGVIPLLKLLDKHEKKSKMVAADKVVGKAAAFLHISLGVEAIYADVISIAALQLFRRYNVFVEYGTVVDRIMNRAGDGYCPMETLVMETDDVSYAVELLKEKTGYR